MNESAIAVIGIGLRFPGAADWREFWKNLLNGRNSIEVYTEEELLRRGVSEELLSNPKYVRLGATIEGYDQFDENFFNYSSSEAALIDPQQRIFLQCCYEAFQDAACVPQSLDVPVGVFAGVGANSYLMRNILPHNGKSNNIDPLQVLISNDKDFISTRVSYKLSLKGPSVNIQTACSSSLTAVHMACKSILDGECEMALAGGASISNFNRLGYLYIPNGILSPDGHCRSFGIRANGSVGGDGVGVVLLKEYNAALRDKNRIYAVLRGSALNNDGGQKLGFTAPSAVGQEAVIREALAVAELIPDQIDMVEGHGSATALGDAVEIEALNRIFSKQTGHRSRCALGSVKSNIGHLNAASGIAGLIKAVLSLYHRKIPPTLDFEEESQLLKVAYPVFYLPGETTSFEETSTNPKAGVSSFGLGGSNVHVVLEAAGVPRVGEDHCSPVASRLVPISAHNPESMNAVCEEISDMLRSSPDLVEEVAYYLQTGREHFGYRKLLQVGSDSGDFFNNVESLNSIQKVAEPPPVVFLFAGLGDHHVGMAYELYCEEPFFKQEFDRCSEKFKLVLGSDIRETLFTTAARKGHSESGIPQDEEAWGNLPLTHAALFTLEYALGRYWMYLGIEPSALIGYSLGELVAASLAEVMTLDAAIDCVAKRAELMTGISGGMLAVSGKKDRMKEFQSVAMAEVSAYLSPISLIFSGSAEQITASAEKAASMGLVSRALRNAGPFHSRHMDDAADEFARYLANFKLREPKIPIVSNVFGKSLGSQMCHVEYWRDQIVRPVQFEKSLSTFMENGRCVFLEIGPGPSLGTFVFQHPAKTKEHQIVYTLLHRDQQMSALDSVTCAIAKLWTLGAEVRWHNLHRGLPVPRTPLPFYRFKNQKHWIDPPRERNLEIHQSDDAHGAKCYRIDWRSDISLDREVSPNKQRLWIVSDDLMEGFTNLPDDRNTLCFLGSRYAAGNFCYEVRTGNQEDFEKLFASLSQTGRFPEETIYVVGNADTNSDEAISLRIERLFYGVLHLIRALVRENPLKKVVVRIAVENAVDVTGGEDIYPEYALLSGTLRVVPKEYPNIDVCVVDLGKNLRQLWGSPNALRCLLTVTPGELLAVRGAKVWKESIVPVKLDCSARVNIKLGGTYLIIGGLGGIGLEIADFVSSRAKVNLILVSRSSTPDSGEIGDPHVVERIRRIEKSGSVVVIRSADVANITDMQNVIDEISGRFEMLTGIFHCAGIAGGGLIQQRSKLDMESVLSAKVDGSRVLEKILEKHSPEFLLLCSSVASFIGEIGQMEYTAANAYLNAFAAYFNKHYSTYAVSISWDRWVNIGMGDRLAQKAPDELIRCSAQTEIKGDVDQYGLTREQAIETLDHILGSKPDHHVIVSNRLDNLLNINRGQNQAMISAMKIDSRQMIPRPDLSVEFVQASTEAEKKLEIIWKEILGVSRVGIDDRFFDLGGNSLLGIKLLADINQDFGIRLPIAAIYEASSIRSFCRKFLESGKTEEAIISYERGLSRRNQRSNDGLRRKNLQQGREGN